MKATCICQGEQSVLPISSFAVYCTSWRPTAYLCRCSILVLQVLCHIHYSINFSLKNSFLRYWLRNKWLFLKSASSLTSTYLLEWKLLSYKLLTVVTVKKLTYSLAHTPYLLLEFLVSYIEGELVKLLLFPTCFMWGSIWPFTYRALFFKKAIVKIGTVLPPVVSYNSITGQALE